LRASRRPGLERDPRTVRAAGWAEEQPADSPAAQARIAPGVETYTHTRLHRTLNSLTPAEASRGDPKARVAERQAPLLAARQRRRAAGEAFHGAARSAGGRKNPDALTHFPGRLSRRIVGKTPASLRSDRGAQHFTTWPSPGPPGPRHELVTPKVLCYDPSRRKEVKLDP
jgi:hypothetical protein